MSPTVSLVIPAYNAEAYLREALDSAFAQTRPPDEVIVVDDGSGDRTPEIAASYGDRVRLLRQPNRGEAAARNTGVRVARGDLIAFLDADDTLLPRCLEAQLRFPEGLRWGLQRAAAERASSLYRRFRFLAREMLATGEVEEARRCAILSLQLWPRNPIYAAEALAVALAPGVVVRLLRRGGGSR